MTILEIGRTQASAEKGRLEVAYLGPLQMRSFSADHTYLYYSSADGKGFRQITIVLCLHKRLAYEVLPEFVTRH